MGRTVNTWRMRLETEIESLAPYRRALTTTDRTTFDSMMRSVRQRRSAGGMLPGLEPFKPMLLSMLLDAQNKIQLLEDRLDELAQSMGS